MSKVLVIGAAAYQVPAIKRIHELGFEAYCVDYKDGQPGYAYADGYRIIDVRNKEACLAYARELGIDGVMSWGSTLTLETVSYIAEQMSLCALPYKTAVIARDKFLIRKHLTEQGLNSAGVVFKIGGRNDIANHEYNLPFVVKPCDGSGSKGVRIVTKRGDIADALEYAFDGARNGEVYVEPFIPGEEYSAEAFACNGDVFVYTIVKTRFEWGNDYPEYTQTTYLGLSEPQVALIEKEIKQAVNSLGVNIGPVNFDFIISSEDGKPYIIDVGIRNGQNLIASHIVPYSRGVDELDNIIFMSLGKSVDARPKRTSFITSRLLIYSPGLISEIKPFCDLIGRNHIVDIIMRKQAGDYLPRYQTKADTCGWVLTEGITPEESLDYGNIAWENLKDYIIIKDV